MPSPAMEETNKLSSTIPGPVQTPPVGIAIIRIESGLLQKGAVIGSIMIVLRRLNFDTNGI